MFADHFRMYVRLLAIYHNIVRHRAK